LQSSLLLSILDTASRKPFFVGCDNGVWRFGFLAVLPSNNDKEYVQIKN
jgi:hypothetical protein